MKARKDSVGSMMALWLMLRVLSSVWLALVSRLRPLSAMEQTVPLWPPSAPVDQWLARVWLYPAQRWDVQYYVWIVERGYAPTDGTAPFHPLYPALARVLAAAGLHPLLALFVVSSVASVALVYLFHRFVASSQGEKPASASALLFMVSPFAMSVFLPYPEALFLVWAILCFLALGQKRWWWAGIAGALAVLTRQQGVLLMLPLAWTLWQASRGEQVRLALLAKWAPLLLLPVAYFGWVLYRAVALADVQLSSIGLHDFIYGVLVSPSAAQVVPYQTFMWPWRVIGLALAQLIQSPDVDLVVNVVGGVVFLGLLIWTWREMDWPGRLFTLAVTVVSFSFYTGPVHPLMGLLRHLLLAFPVFAALGVRLRQHGPRLASAFISLLAQFFLYLLYSLEAWVP